MTRPSIKSPCVADRHHAPNERIAEVRFPNGKGCLLSLRQLEDGTCSISVYRADPGIFVGTEAPAPKPQASRQPGLASYEARAVEFADQMEKEGFTRKEAEQILEDADVMQKFAVDYCNRSLSQQEAEADEAAMKRIAKLCKAHDVEADFNGDPRGHVVKLHLKSGTYNTWGGAEAGYGVPTREH